MIEVIEEADEDMDTRILRGIREASPHVVSDTAVAPQDGSGPCRSVKHQKHVTGCISLKAHDPSIKSVRYPLSPTSVGRERPSL